MRTNSLSDDVYGVHVDKYGQTNSKLRERYPTQTTYCKAKQRNHKMKEHSRSIFSILKLSHFIANTSPFPTSYSQQILKNTFTKSTSSFTSSYSNLTRHLTGCREQTI